MVETTKTHGLWDETAIQAPVTPTLGVNQSVDAVVVGAGITGLSTALHLATQGAKVAVLEAREIGFGGSGRNVGLVNPGMWVRPDDICKELGQETGEHLIDILGKAPGLVFDVIKRHRLDCEAVNNGTLHCAIGPAGLEEIRDRAAQWQRRGVAVRLLDASETARRVGSSAFTGSLLDERAGTIQPLSYVRGLAGAAQSEGADIYTGSEVLNVERTGKRWKLGTRSGSVTADWVVASTNAYSGSLWPALRDEIIPVYYFQCATAPVPEALRCSILANREGLICTRTVITSLRTDAAGRLIFGSLGSLRNMGAGVHPAYAKRILRRMFPELENVQFEHEWFGRIAMTANHLPRYHELDRQVIGFHAYNGRGIGTGTMFGKIMADHIVSPRQHMPLPATQADAPVLRGLRSAYYEMGAVVAHLL
ncbi:NAD(P)/FAD-dependent oxidoreductase [Burkholderia gladioli]|uniref:NAD(P)/FAD-dependent oxidoreductase n=1 Tax=Burkholderia gladioli TaxID=28095 RepID=UPI001640EA23|nr:FAD-binding oxidoreductase [Burkholderia gladioli]